ncbi:magnesium transporter MgtC [Sulfurifustis variabilis]|uniref:Protein MgtC n=1 Tax=Sulfurifustis variabilis TaxID=1675686 RepID=A0A1B4VCS7_9GAMM|nr:MgtC/SapB family protein [Sulfurifustis variabilis]BAU49691.1 magnesium transporter MgtC [Sulfurifustis variabilis]
MDWNNELVMVLRAVFAALLGGIVGWERERHGREAGVRTYAAVSLGAGVFALVSSHVDGATDPTRAANVVTGVGFLGAGVILREQGRVAGLTTAATIWATAAVGLAVGYGMYVIGVLTSIVIFSLLALHHFPAWRSIKARARHHSHPEKRA